MSTETGILISVKEVNYKLARQFDANEIASIDQTRGGGGRRIRLRTSFDSIISSLRCTGLETTLTAGHFAMPVGNIRGWMHG